MYEKKQLKQEAGSTAIEFAFVAPILFLLLAGIIEYSFAIYVGLVMDTQLASIARLGKALTTSSSLDSNCNPNCTGTCVTGTLTKSIIDSCIKNRISVLGVLDKTKINICEIDYGYNWNSYTPNIGTACANASSIFTHGGTEQTATGSAIGSAGDTISYNVTYDWHFVTPIISNFFTGNNSGWRGSTKTTNPGVLTLTSTVNVTNNNNSR